VDRGPPCLGSREVGRIVGAAFYCVADEGYFLGAVGLVNSLRAAGHTQPIFVLDCGLTDEQRGLLQGEARVVPTPTDAPPHVLKAVAPLQHPADVMVLIDTDMLVTRSLAPLVERAAEGRIVAFRDRQERFVPRWGELLELGEARPGPYVSSGLVVLGGPAGERVLATLDGLQSKVDFELTFWRRNVRDYPFLYADQDLLNAVLRATPDRDRLLALEHRLAPTPPFEGLRLLDEVEARCAYGDGVEPYLLHHYHRKPWLVPVYHGIYSRLLARFLLGPGITVRVPERQVPLRLRSGIAARFERARVNTVDVFRRYVLKRPALR
jgi:hypothetical protein